MANIQARRRLDALFMRGVEVRFGNDPDTGAPKGKIGPFKDADGREIPCPEEEVAMFVRPPNPVQRDMAMREGQAKRARSLVKAKRDEDSEEHLTILAFLADMSDEVLREYVVAADVNVRAGDAEREILALEEWKDMLTYQEAARQFSEMSPEELEDNPEWEAFQELDDKYAKQVSKRERELSDAQHDALKFIGRDQVEKKALAKRAELTGSQAFIVEYEKWMLYYSCREPENPNNLFYGSVDEWDAADEVIKMVVSEALEPFINDQATAKNLPGAASGSDSSEPPVKPETSESSTREERIA